jgi:two-component system sensor histidine kinase YesM
LNSMISFFANLKIKYKIFLLIAVLMASVIILTNVVHNFAFKAYDELVYQQSSKALDISSLSMESEFKKISVLSYNVVTDSAIQEYLWDIRNADTEYVSYISYTKIRQRLVDLGALDKYVLSLQLYDVNDTEYTVGARPVTLNEERLERLRTEAIKFKGGISWTSPDENDHVLTAVRHIRRYQDLSLDGLGVVAIRIDVNRLFSDYVNGIDHEESSFIIVKGDNEVVYPDKLDLDLKTLSDMKDQRSRYRIVRSNDKAYFLTFRQSALTDWTYYTVTPYDNIFYSTINAKKMALIIYLALFLIASIVALQLSKRITDPLEKLTHRMRRVQLGNFDYEEDGKATLGMDEVGQIQRHFRMMLQRINELIQENYVKQLMIKDTQFKALQAQINPHFLYNTLESINWMAKMSKQERISRMVESLGFLLRLSINEKEVVITLQRELEILQHYLIIQKLRFEERLNFSLQVPAHLNSCDVPKLSVQPIIENAIHYALEPKIEPCTIVVSAQIQDNCLFISIADNGPGMSESFLEKLKTGEVKPQGTGLGLSNIRDRIKMLYGEEYGIKIESDRGFGTIVTLILPYIVRDEHV